MSAAPAGAGPGSVLPERLAFGRFELQPRERRLLVDDVETALGARAFDLLLALALRPGELVTKSELLDLVWPGLVVEEANLPVQMSALRKVLGGDVIVTIPGRGYRFVAPLQTPDAADAPPVSAVQEVVPGLPAGISLIARDEEIRLLSRALREPGCLTLAGPGGVGKTSLARALAAGWERGSVWVDLAPLPAAEQVAPALARAMNMPLPAQDADRLLARAVGERLLVLDNAEHLVDAAAAMVARLLGSASSLRILVTTQVPLAVSAEHVHRIDPLALPIDNDALDLHRGAIAMFVDRVQAADHRFHAVPEMLPLLRETCRRLDGLPLALEMAAARVPMLGLRGVCDALDERFKLLASARRGPDSRHRTLHAALEWSHGLLGPDEQRLLRGLAVFAGGFTLDLAVALASDAEHDRWAVIDSLSLLVDRSLVATDSGDPPRYRLLETVRGFALEQLAAAGDEHDWRRRHAFAVFDLCQRSFRNGGDDRLWAEAAAEHDNVREAIAWAKAHEPALALDLVTAASSVAILTSWRREAFEWHDSCTGIVDDAATAPEARASWWVWRSSYLLYDGSPGAYGAGQHALELCQALGDRQGVVQAMVTMAFSTREPEALQRLRAELQVMRERQPPLALRFMFLLEAAIGTACLRLGELDHYLSCCERTLEVARRLGSARRIHVAENNLIDALQQLGRHADVLERADSLLARHGDSDQISILYTWAAKIESLIALGRGGEVRDLAGRVLPAIKRFGAANFEALATLLLAFAGRPRAAARRIGHGRAAIEAGRNAPSPGARVNLNRADALVREALDAPSYERLVAEGRAMDDVAADRLLLAADGDP